VTLIKEVAKFTVKIILTIIKDALTGNLPGISDYKTNAKIILLDIIQQTNWSQAGQAVKDILVDINFEEIVNPLTNTARTLLGPMDSVLQIFTVVQDISDFPGIIKDLINLIGPNLVITIVSELLNVAIELIFNALYITLGTQNIDTFIGLIDIDSFISTNNNRISALSQTEIFDIEKISTISGLINQLGYLGSSGDFSFLGDFLIHIMMKLQAVVTTNIIFDTILNILAAFIGGLVFLIHPKINFASFSSLNSGQNNTSKNEILSTNEKTHPLPTRLFHITIFLALSVLSRGIDSLLNIKEDAWENNPKRTKWLRIISISLSGLNWIYTAGISFPFFDELQNLPNIPGFLVSEYGSRFGYLGSNAFSFLLNQAAAAIGHWLNNEKVVSILQIAAATITILAAGIYGEHSAWGHFVSEDWGILIGDLAFILQAGFLQLFLAINNLFNIIDWKNYSVTSTLIKRELFFFLLNTCVFDFTMVLVFLAFAK